MAKVATPTASPAAGPYATNQTVTLSCTTVGSTIFYTNDGTTPTHTAGTPTGTTQIYTTPITVVLGTTIKALGFLTGDTDSNVLTAAYTQGYTISGSLGAAGAGAIVFVVASGATGTLKLQVTADGSGNYTTGLLSPGTMWVQPVIWQGNFTPGRTSVTITAANVTGVNFACTPVTYTALGSDTFNRANENPLSQGGNWTAAPGWGALQLVSDAVEPATTADPSGMDYKGFTWTNDCWAQLQIATSSNDSDTAALVLRWNDGAADGYGLSIEGNVGATNTFLNLGIYSAIALGLGFSNQHFQFAANAIFTLVVIGQNLYGYMNQVPCACWVDATIASGIGHMDVISGGAVTLITVKNFAGGSVANTPPPSTSTRSTRSK